MPPQYSRQPDHEPRRGFLRSAIMLILTVAGLQHAVRPVRAADSAPPQPRRPNIVLILADDK